jgi:hypothetical protein
MHSFKPSGITHIVYGSSEMTRIIIMRITQLPITNNTHSTPRSHINTSPFTPATSISTHYNKATLISHNTNYYFYLMTFGMLGCDPLTFTSVEPQLIMTFPEAHMPNISFTTLQDDPSTLAHDSKPCPENLNNTIPITTQQ